MLGLALASVAFGHMSSDVSLTYKNRNLKADCDCSWTSIPGACSTPDGSVCWTQCCSGPSPSPDPSPAPTPGPGKPVELVQEYLSDELATEYFGKNLTKLMGPMSNGFSRQGSMRYHSAEKLNLLGGGLTFTVDLSGVNDMVNANLYLVIPGTLDSGSHFYCDNSQNYVNQGNACIELDIMESNGHSLAASTMHTKIGTNSGCDTWGCRALTYFGGTIDGSQPFDVQVTVASDGDLKIYYKQNGKTATAFDSVSGFDGAAKAAIVDGMNNYGAVVVSSMWTGWVPPNTSGTGDLSGSHYTVSNVMYEGSSKGNTM